MRKTLGGLTLSVALVLGMAANLAQAHFYVIPVPAGGAPASIRCLTPSPSPDFITWAKI